VPQSELLQLLASVQAARGGASQSAHSSSHGDVDCSIEPTQIEGVFLVSTTDFFYPLVDDPHTQGRIACANVVSDLYALGLAHCDTVLMLLAASTEMEPAVRRRATELVMLGFNDAAADAGTRVTGGQTVLNPWPIIGGVASVVCRERDFIRPIHARPGDVLVLTKPLGTQLAVNAAEWHRKKILAKKAPSFVRRYAAPAALPADAAEPLDDDRHVSPAATAAVAALLGRAVDGMTRLNRHGALAMHRHGAHAATDVTGFGIRGHARNLALAQTADVSLRIDRLVLYKDTPLLATEAVGFKLLAGYSAETSGGLLVCLPPDTADAFIADMCANSGPAWRVGEVVACASREARDAFFADNVEVLEV